MKKIVKLLCATFLILLLTETSLNAQIHLGLKGGLNIASVIMSEEIIKPYNVTGFHVGPIIEVMAPIGIGFDAAVLYSQKGVELKGGGDPISTDYLDIPVNLKLKFGIPVLKLYLTGGPYAEIRLSDAENKWEKIQTDLKTKSFAAGINVGGGLEVLQRLQVGITYGFGLTDDYSINKINTAEVTAKTKTIAISATLLF